MLAQHLKWPQPRNSTQKCDGDTGKFRLADRLQQGKYAASLITPRYALAAVNKLLKTAFT